VTGYFGANLPSQSLDYQNQIQPQPSENTKNLNNNYWTLLTYAKLNLTKPKPGSGRLLCHPAIKWIGIILQLPRPAIGLKYMEYKNRLSVSRLSYTLKMLLVSFHYHRVTLKHSNDTGCYCLHRPWPFTNNSNNNIWDNVNSAVVMLQALWHLHLVNVNLERHQNVVVQYSRVYTLQVILLVLSPKKVLIYHRTQGIRLSRPRHCSNEYCAACAHGAVVSTRNNCPQWDMIVVPDTAMLLQPAIIPVF